MKKNILLFCLILCVCSCKEDDPTSLSGNEYVNEYMFSEPGMSVGDNSADLEKYLKIWLPVYEGYYTVSEEYVKTKHSMHNSVQVRQILSFGKSDCSIRDLRDIEEHVGYSNDRITIYKFKEGSFEKTHYDPSQHEEINAIYYVKADGLYSQVTYANGDKEEKILLPFIDEFQCKFLSHKGTIADYEDLTYTTDNAETFTYTQTGNEILMVNEEKQIKGLISSDYKTISLTQISPDTREIGNFNYK